jgi:hypothetical protein
MSIPLVSKSIPSHGATNWPLPSAFRLSKVRSYVPFFLKDRVLSIFVLPTDCVIEDPLSCTQIYRAKQFQEKFLPWCDGWAIWIWSICWLWGGCNMRLCLERPMVEACLGSMWECANGGLFAQFICIVSMWLALYFAMLNSPNEIHLKATLFYTWDC